MALRFASLLWHRSSSTALSADCSGSIVSIVGTITCILTALAPCVSGTWVHGARNVIRYAEAGGSTGGVFTPGFGSLCLSLSSLGSLSLIATVATAAPTRRPLLLKSFRCFISSSSSPGRPALSCVIRIF